MSCYPSKTPQNDKFAIHFSCFKPKFFLRLSRSYICQRKGSCFLLVPLPFSAFHIFHHFLIYICFDPLLCLECLLYSLHSSISKDLMKADFCKSTRKPNFDYISAVTVTSQWDSCVLLFVNEIWRGRQCCSLKKPQMRGVWLFLRWVNTKKTWIYILKKVFFKKLVFSVRSIDPWL